MTLAPAPIRPADPCIDDSASLAVPPSATGLYPDPVWEDAASPPPVGVGLDEDAMPLGEPPSATGHYPDPIWAEASPSASFAAGLDSVAERSMLSLKEDDTGEANAAPAPAGPVAPIELTNEAAYRIIREVARPHSGGDGYSAVSPDLEYSTPGHPAFGRRHFGLEFGLCLFSQRSGLLGRVLELTRQRTQAGYRALFDPYADDLLAVATSPNEEARLGSVGGERLWSPAWVERFRLAGAMAECQAAQNETAIELEFRPIARIATSLGLDTDRTLAMAYDVVVSRGLEAGTRWLVANAGAIRTDGQRDTALRSLGFADLAGFLSARGLPPASGLLDATTQVALVEAVRGTGGSILPTADDLACRLIRAARGAARTRLELIHSSEAFEDIVYVLPSTPPVGA